MNRLDTPSQNAILIPDFDSPQYLETTRRLIVLVPTAMEYTTMTRRIWKLANESNSTVQLLGLYKDTIQEPTLRRELVTMAALIQDAKVPVEIKIEKGSNWVNAVKHTYRTGDTIVCSAEQPIGIQRRPLSQVLESDLKAPVYILSGLPPRPQKSNLFSQLMVWSGFFGIIAGFFMLQVKISQSPQGWTQTLLLVLLLIPEFWLIQLWNSLFS